MFLSLKDLQQLSLGLPVAKVDFFFETAQLLRPVNTMTEHHTSVSKGTLSSPVGFKLLNRLCPLLCCSVIYPPRVYSEPWGPRQPSTTQCLSAVLCLSAERTCRRDSIISSQHKQGTEAQGSLPEVAQAVGEEGIKLVFLRLELGQ